MFALHIPLLRLPYFWDEAGYYVPAARDLLLSGSLIPRSTPSNAHPPLVMAYLALWWKIAGYAPTVTRTAMLLISTLSLAGVFRLARRVANTEVAIASTICVALYPVFFTQSSLAHVDLAAAGLTFWALGSYVERRHRGAAMWFSLAVLAKETAVLAPLALLLWELVCPVLHRGPGDQSLCLFPQRSWKSALLLAPALLLAVWYSYHYLRTGAVFGNPEFFRYNVQATLHPMRVLLAFLLRLWQTLGYLGLYLLTAATLFALWCPAICDAGGERRRIAPGVQLALLVVIASYVIFLAMVGGAILARYMLPVVPLAIIIGVSTLRRRVQMWRWVVAIVVLAFVVGLLVNPPYEFSPEDNLTYRDYILLHQHAENFVEARYPMARVLTAWPASDELSRPYLGYLTRPMRVVRIEDFSVEQLIASADMRSEFDVALVFSTKYQPAHTLFENWPTWVQWKTRFFGYHRDVPPAAAAQLLGGRLVYTERRRGEWVGVIEMEPVMEARASR
ncbi:MAG TPA: glycosyltransferase family 39 protein [Terriglobales bacterium]|nr:glycosyltransferase family 39 protein [Terriglobales bacterium]